MKWMLAAVAVMGLAGCASQQPVGPQTRAEWEALHTHVYKGVSVNQALDAAQRILQAVDHDTRFDFPPNRLLAERRWSVNALIASTVGTDRWDIRAEPVPDGVAITIQASRDVSSNGPSPVIGVGGASPVTGVALPSNSMSGMAVHGPLTYNLFWSRMDYALGLTSAWYTCFEFRHSKGAGVKQDAYILCGNGASEAPPT